MSEERPPMRYRVELDREDDGRWIAEIPALPGVMSYGVTRDKAVQSAAALALRVIADRVEHGEHSASGLEVSFDASPATAR